MTSTPRVRGDLCGLNIKDETSYGVPVAGDCTYGGTTLTIKDADTETRQPYYTCGKRIRAGSKLIATATGYSATFNAVSGKDLVSAWLKYAGLSGSATYSTVLLPYTTLIKVGENDYHLFAGCSVDSFELSASEIGGFVEFSVDAKAKYHSLATAVSSFTDPDGASVATLNPVAVPDGVPIVWTKPWKYGGTSAELEIPATSWSITVSNNLQSHPAMGGGIRLDDGLQPTVGEYSVTATITFPSTDRSWDLLRQTHEDFYNFAVEVDGYQIELVDCTINPAGPSRTSEGNYDETLELDARSVNITKVTS